MDYRKLGPKGAAQRHYQDGQGLESNPFTEREQREAFAMEMHRLQGEELRREMAENYA